MNYLPFCGYWFYGGENASKTAFFYSSWGLFDGIGGVKNEKLVKIIGSAFKKLIG